MARATANEIARTRSTGHRASGATINALAAAIPKQAAISALRRE